MSGFGFTLSGGVVSNGSDIITHITQPTTGRKGHLHRLVQHVPYLEAMVHTISGYLWVKMCTFIKGRLLIMAPLSHIPRLAEEVVLHRVCNFSEGYE